MSKPKPKRRLVDDRNPYSSRDRLIEERNVIAQQLSQNYQQCGGGRRVLRKKIGPN